MTIIIQNHVKDVHLLAIDVVHSQDQNKIAKEIDVHLNNIVNLIVLIVNK
jgi:hypothetical protein